MARGSYIIWFISLLFLLLLWPPLLWHWVAKSCPTLWTNGLQHARLLCPPLSSGVCSNLCLLSQWCNLTISSSAFFLLLSIFPSIRVFSNESVLHIRWPKYWSFSFSISPSNEYLGLISFRIDWFDLLAVQGILKTYPEPQFESINSWALRLLYDPTVTTVHDYRKNHLLFSHSVVSYFFQPHGLQHARLPCPSLSPGVGSNSCPLSPWYLIPSNHLILCRPLLLLPSIFPSIRVLFQWVSSSYQMAKVLEFQL